MTARRRIFHNDPSVEVGFNNEELSIDPWDIVNPNLHVVNVDGGRVGDYDPDGTEQRPFKTIAAAQDYILATIGATALNAGSDYATIRLASGIYAEDVVVDVPMSFEGLGMVLLTGKVTDSGVGSRLYRNLSFMDTPTSVEVGEGDTEDLVFDGCRMIVMTMEKRKVALRACTVLASLTGTNGILNTWSTKILSLVWNDDSDTYGSAPSDSSDLNINYSTINGITLTMEGEGTNDFVLSLLNSVVDDDFAPPEMEVNNFSSCITGTFTVGDSTYVSKGGYPAEEAE